MTLLTTRSLSKMFGGLRAVDDVDFDLQSGEVRALIGPNGAGKSTFVGLICGRIQADSGRVMFENVDITHLDAHRRISLGMAYTFQITSIFANLPVLENVALAARQRWPGNAKAVIKKSQAALAQVDLADRSDILAGNLSYGHQRLLEIAMGIVQEPKLLILDEPTQGLAQSEIEGFIGLIGQLRQRSTVLLIEHNMDVVMRTAERITVLDAGRILAEGSPQTIRADASVQAAYLGTA